MVHPPPGMGALGQHAVLPLPKALGQHVVLSLPQPSLLAALTRALRPASSMFASTPQPQTVRPSLDWSET